MIRVALGLLCLFAVFGCARCGDRPATSVDVTYVYLIDADGGTLGIFVPAGTVVYFSDSGTSCIMTYVDGGMRCSGWYADFLSIDGGVDQ